MNPIQNVSNPNSVYTKSVESQIGGIPNRWNPKSVESNRRAISYVSRHLMQDQRSVGKCGEWLVEMAAGGYTAHLCEIMTNLQDANGLRSAGFILPAVQAPFTSMELGRACENDIIHEIVEEDEFAELYGTSTLALTVARAARGYWMYAGGGRMAAALHSTEMAKQCVDMFMVDEA